MKGLLMRLNLSLTTFTFSKQGAVSKRLGPVVATLQNDTPAESINHAPLDKFGNIGPSLGCIQFPVPMSDIPCESTQEVHSTKGAYAKNIINEFLGESAFNEQVQNCSASRIPDSASPFLPQGGIEWLQQLIKHRTEKRDVTNMLENFLFLCGALYDVKNKRQAAAIICLYIKTTYNQSIMEKVRDYLIEQGLFTDSEMPHNTEVLDREYSDGSYHPYFDIQSGEEHWLDSLRGVNENWKVIRNSPAFSKISTLLSMCAALGLCDLANFNFTVKGVKLFSIPAMKKQIDAAEFATACLDTIEYFVTGGYKCFVDKNFDPLLYEDAGAQEFEDNYFRLLEYSNAVRCGNLHKVCDDLDENDYGELLDDTIDKCKSYLKALPQGPQKRDMAVRRDRLGKIRTDFRQYRVSGKLRQAPYGIYIHGTSSVGKSYTCALLSRLILKVNNFNCDDDRFMTINEADRYLSNADAKINCIQVDDMGNTKPDFTEKSPAQKIIELVNNVPYYANMAELEMKGKISLEPKVVSVTSNLQLSRVAQIYSMDIMSITRRMLQIEQFVKPEFRIEGTMMLDGKKVQKAFGDDPYPDVYTFIVRRSYNNNGRTEQRSVLREHCDLEELCAYLVEDSMAHFKNQEFVVENSKNLGSKITLCNSCKKPEKFCKCCEDDVSIDMEAVRDFIEGDDDSSFDKQSGTEVRDEVRRDSANLPADYNWVLKCFYYMPDCVFYNPIAQFIQTLLQFNRFMRHIKDEAYFYKTCLTICLYFCWLNIFCGISMLFLTGYFFLLRCFLIHVQMSQYRSIERNFMPSTLAAIRADRYARLLGSCAAIAALYKIVKLLHSVYKITYETQGSLAPRTDAEARQRMAEKNPWVGATLTKVPQKLKVDSSWEQLQFSLENNLLYLRFINETEVRYCNSIALKNCKITFPTHMFLPGQEKVTFEIYRGKAWDANAEAYVRKKIKEVTIYKNKCERISQDVYVCHVPSCADFCDITKFFPDDHLQSFGAILMHRDTLGDMVRHDIHCDYLSSVTVGSNSFEAYRYTLPCNTFRGLCMSMVISKTKPSVIAGFHLGGKPDSPLGVAGMTTKAKIEEALARLSIDDPSVLEAHSGGDFTPEVYGVKIITDTKIHPKSCMNHLPADNPINILGSTIGRASHTKSDVITTPISADIIDVCKIDKDFGPPKLHPWRNYWETIEKISNPVKGPDSLHLEWAAKDFLAPLLKLIEKPFWKTIVTPLTWMESICGIDGQRFVKKMPRDTSIGFPLSGTKEKDCIFLDPEVCTTHQCPVDMTDRIKDEVARITEIYLSGERAYPVYKAALKDEPTKTTKDKVRVFFAAPVALQLLVRKYFLPVCNFMQLNPLKSECAVGVNAAGPEWDELSRHMMQFGEERIFAGDYSAYDTRMPIEVSTAAWNIFIEIAQKSGNYTENDITIMRGVATDCCYPVVAYNGDLIQINGLHVSGVNITAAVGGNMNSILNRCGYYYNYLLEGGDPNLVPPFQDKVVLVVYGDDFKGSIAKSCTWFDHIKYRDYLAMYGMVLTMPDKTSTPTPFMKDCNADFLKRKNVFNEETGLYFGALDKASIFKNLHCVLRSKVVTPLEQSAMNIDGALREMFYHGKEDYEVLREQLREVASRHSIEGECRMLSTTYEDEMLNFKRKYLDPDLPLPEPEPVPDDFECQGGYEGSCELFPLAVDCFAFENGRDELLLPWEFKFCMAYLAFLAVLFGWMVTNPKTYIVLQFPNVTFFYLSYFKLLGFSALGHFVNPFIHIFVLYIVAFEICLFRLFLLREEPEWPIVHSYPKKRCRIKVRRLIAQSGVEQLTQSFENIELDQREVNRQTYEWRHENQPPVSSKNDRPTFDADAYYCTKRSALHLRYSGFSDEPKSKYILIPKSKKNFIDLIKLLKTRPAFYQDRIYLRGEDVGDVDLGFVIHGDLFIFEIKRSLRRTPRGNAQAKLNLYHLQMMNGGMRIHSFTMRGHVISHIASNCKPTRKQLKLGIFD